jgi:pimeloyl-ACP methyl ester carboxylesterase
VSTPLVLVHGGGHGAWCWEPMLPFLDTPALAVDLPPKALRTGALRSDPRGPGPRRPVKRDDFDPISVPILADSIIAAVDAAGMDRFVLVGHSTAGVAIPEVVRRIPERVTHLVFVSASIPPEGGSVVDTLVPELLEVLDDAITRSAAADVGNATLDQAMARYMFCNDMDAEQTRFVTDRLCAESTTLIAEPVSRVGIPRDIPKTYVRLSRDQAMPPDRQVTMIANLEASPGGHVAVVELDSGHDAMVSHPPELAAVLNRIAAD